ncbi:hypothetical protein NMG29_20340 [Streptomyces cocklensis]|jgi:hypothetical protein|uniref:Uncharacterized protein n=1 Tax=Actinacidiphila cocklensis TaxID=887465 RepID=A0A9W4DPI5_9ACTN|nr:hypothetical protein [Actinacidiphila cocklensis]MDD1060526.1 hypothetical protein [Actinacidiphila cocklensis]WSX73942.1 hypothetical protein OH826_08755 [Streptomyces sp. NBC_00899]WSX79993.1 hypothetical protein OH826_42755 [Streptomyces sp. NBC_00899]CAG6393928.1 conserved hypothetical protein [Actinacidiphila cocklensis]
MAESKVERRVGRLARQVDAFAKAHGGVDVSVEYLGQRGARIVLVGQDGSWGDLVAPTYAIAQAAATSADATVKDAFDGEMAARVRTGRYEWRRMAGIQMGGRANT